MYGLASFVRVVWVVLTGSQPGGQGQPPLPSSNLRLIQALQPGLSRTSDLRRLVGAWPAPDSSRLPPATAAPASSKRSPPSVVNEEDLVNSAGVAFSTSRRDRLQAPHDGASQLKPVKIRLARRPTWTFAQSLVWFLQSLWWHRQAVSIQLSSPAKVALIPARTRLSRRPP